MGIIIISSNYLVQFPINHFNLEEILTYGAFTYPVTFLITDFPLMLSLTFCFRLLSMITYSIAYDCC